MILYKSTRGDKNFFTFSEVILKGIAPDGGLFVPARIPNLSLERLKSLVGKSYQEVCFCIINLFETDFSQDLLRKIISKSYANNFDTPKIAPLIHLKNKQYILELFHGPTLAFKDMALQIMPLIFSVAAKSSSHRYLILVATSGDTGKAALEGYKDKEGVEIIVFYPYQGVSHLQELSMITQEGNNLAVYGMRGNFDDVQQSVKEAFNDKKFNQRLLKEKNLVLSSANSINWGRLIPQIVYHVGSYLDLVAQEVIKIGEEIDIAVPTGNFGNILAAYYAQKMGLPIRRLICTSNANNVLTEFLKTGIYDISNRVLIKTSSPSMDIIVASNIERLLYELTRDSNKVTMWMKQLQNEKRFIVDEKTKKILQFIFYADWVTNENCLLTIRRIYNETQYLMDPHTAVAQEVAERYKRKFTEDVPVVICATAHWAKFPRDVYKALTRDTTNGEDEFLILGKIKRMIPNVAIPYNIANLQDKKVRHTGVCKVGREEIKQIILKTQNPPK